MATIGRRRAIAQLGPFKAGGAVAWLLWLVVHLLFLVDLRSKVSVLLKWGSAYLLYRPTNRLIEDSAPPVASTKVT
jgi:NADH dehydrogenase